MKLFVKRNEHVKLSRTNLQKNWLEFCVRATTELPNLPLIEKEFVLSLCKKLSEKHKSNFDVKISFVFAEHISKYSFEHYVTIFDDLDYKLIPLLPSQLNPHLIIYQNDLKMRNCFKNLIDYLENSITIKPKEKIVSLDYETNVTETDKSIFVFNDDNKNYITEHSEIKISDAIMNDKKDYIIYDNMRYYPIEKFEEYIKLLLENNNSINYLNNHNDMETPQITRKDFNSLMLNIKETKFTLNNIFSNFNLFLLSCQFIASQNKNSELYKITDVLDDLYKKYQNIDERIDSMKYREIILDMILVNFHLFVDVFNYSKVESNEIIIYGILKASILFDIHETEYENINFINNSLQLSDDILTMIKSGNFLK